MDTVLRLLIAQSVMLLMMTVMLFLLYIVCVDNNDILNRRKFVNINLFKPGRRPPIVPRSADPSL